MKMVQTLALAAFTTLAGSAHAEEVARCDNARLMKTLSQLIGGADLKVTATESTVSVMSSTAGQRPEPVLTVTCDDVQVPLASQLARPSRGPAKTATLGPVTVSRTARGAVSLDIAAGALQREAVQVLLLDDQSVSLTRGKDTLYSLATRPDGTVVEVEGRGVGCGCTKTTTPDGKTTTRPL